MILRIESIPCNVYDKSTCTCHEEGEYFHPSWRSKTNMGGVNGEEKCRICGQNCSNHFRPRVIITFLFLRRWNKVYWFAWNYLIVNSIH